MKSRLLILSCFLLLTAGLVQARTKPYFSSDRADEYKVTFQGLFLTEWSSPQQAKALSLPERGLYEETYILSTMKYIYGPLTNRMWGAPQKGDRVLVQWDQPRVVQGRVYLPYQYHATWILNQKSVTKGVFQVPVPITAGVLETPQWTKCTDSDPAHQTMAFYWYFWDPSRPGCDQKEGVHYFQAQVQFIAKTDNLARSYPEYNRMLQNGRDEKGYIRPEMKMTFAFGYTNEQSKYNPDVDSDFGANQYRIFLSFMREFAKRNGLRETPIRTQEYQATQAPQKIIGRRFEGMKNNVFFRINLVTAGDIDQMYLFAKSFAQDHDAFFGWFGHSRVGSGFDTEWMEYHLKESPELFSLTKNYQLIYWAGCNTYSYYTLPFFLMKAGPDDAYGTKGLDIISNGLPSWFALNAIDAQIIFSYLWNYEKRASYQEILRDIEGAAEKLNVNVLVNVLGDEDNPR